ncbi:hypothetical protein GCM10007857_40030 [Bradyrhizobium iriomotense]|uniref:Flp pilus assembly protein CpaB n=1 Tax=Bradyrhizobium iriomotense TaxID=441950 RepID=A0ABQ6AYN0_9BRAD|nr:hypothetical protein [Bradyrhizobium iriomotense]GLR87292.1 hypothetical protein GCM10007857_40030 [Bradyrhizobium iriomotense]
MNTARIVVLTVAIGAGGIAAYLASGSDSPAPIAPVAQLPSVGGFILPNDRVDVLLTRHGKSARRSVADVNALNDNKDEPARRRGETVSVIRFGIPS